MSQLTSPQRHALWTERFERFQATDLTVTEFCRRESVSVPSFYHWRKRLDQNSISKRRPSPTATKRARFISLSVPVMDARPKLNLPGGASIELPSQLNRQQLTDLIAAVIHATDQHTTAQHTADKELR